MVIANIDSSSKLTYEVNGKPFDGIYNVNIKITSIISNEGHISNNLASMFG